MKRPEKVAGHDVGDDGEQHQENGDPENPTVVHSPPARECENDRRDARDYGFDRSQKANKAHYRHRRAWKRKRSEPDWRFPTRTAVHDSTEISVSLSC